MNDVKLYTRIERHIEYLIHRYMHKVRSLKELNWRNKMKAINTYSLQVIRHPAVTVRWPREDMEAAPKQENSTKNSIQRLYMKRMEQEKCKSHHPN